MSEIDLSELISFQTEIAREMDEFRRELRSSLERDIMPSFMSQMASGFGGEVSDEAMRGYVQAVQGGSNITARQNIKLLHKEEMTSVTDNSVIEAVFELRRGPGGLAMVVSDENPSGRKSAFSDIEKFMSDNSESVVSQVLAVIDSTLGG